MHASGADVARCCAKQCVSRALQGARQPRVKRVQKEGSVTLQGRPNSLSQRTGSGSKGAERMRRGAAAYARARAAAAPGRIAGLRAAAVRRWPRCLRAPPAPRMKHDRQLERGSTPGPFTLPAQQGMGWGRSGLGLSEGDECWASAARGRPQHDAPPSGPPAGPHLSEDAAARAAASTW